MPLLCWFDHFLVSRAEICQIFHWFFGKFKASKKHSEINWPFGIWKKNSLRSKSLAILVHYMCFGRFLLAFESRDLSQADKSIIRVSSFPSLLIRGRTFFSVSQQLMLKFSAKWILSILSDLSVTRKTEISVYFLFWMMKLTKTPNCQVLNSCF